MKIMLDEGFLFGAGVFETIQVPDGKAIFCDEHLKRLQKSLEFLGISQSISKKVIQDSITKQTEKNFAIKIIVSFKNVLYLKRENPYLRKDRELGVRLCCTKVLRHSSANMLYHKTTEYYESLLEKKKAK